MGNGDVPWALVFGWRAVRDGGRGPIVLFLLIALELGLAYPLALPYPVLVVGALALAHKRWRLIPELWRSRSWLLGALAIVVLAPAVAGAALKLAAGLRQLLSSRGGLWGGDIVHPLPAGVFTGTGGGVAAALAVLAIAAAGITGVPLPGRLRLPGLERRAALALGGSLGLLCLLDLRFRLDRQGAYMDYKHLAFVGGLVLCVAGAGLARWAAAGGAAAAAAGLLAVTWAALALPHGHREMLTNGLQVDPQMLEIRDWVSHLPRTASVRVDVPPSGVQLWAVYMLGAHPVDASTPLLGTTYAHANYGLRADYALSLVSIPRAHGPAIPARRPLFASGAPLDRNAQFALWRVRWPARLAAIPSTATQALVEPLIASRLAVHPGQEGRVAEQVAAPHALGLDGEAKGPLHSVVGQPPRRPGRAPGDVVQQRADAPDDGSAELGGVPVGPQFLLGRAHADEHDVGRLSTMSSITRSWWGEPSSK